MIEVSPLGAGEDEAWDAFLADRPGGLVYHSTRYRDLLMDHLGCEAEYLVARESGEIRGVLPLMWAGDAAGRICNSLPFYGSHGSPIAGSSEAEQALLDAWNERAADPRTLAATMVANPFLERQPPEPVHALNDERISQATRLPAEPEPESIIALFSKNGRRDARRAERLGVEVKLEPDRLAELHRIHEQNIGAHGGQAKSAEFFEGIERHFRRGEDFDLWVARADGEMIAALLVLYFKEVAEYYTPAVEPEHRGKEPMALILWRAMAEAARRGCRLWNWGGTWSSQDGVYHFKRKWGANERRYRYFVKVNDGDLLDSTPEELRERFPHFYVAPYSALRTSEPAAEPG